ncbi:uncharacterized protein BO66DRAFT_433422 [Aspergillus aculeatinus CBS 121060]|uniref:Uncharacterized protein n=1 Tax=Aspergillus aculeatinus CBS 121060 TaxID=1448322 RepID=A0ACD1HPP6_9EURO|nr:hypothetical protein BO66DRAFT_433422 [Aspergillus aculeatinus CBS 121060]RAH75343.1 hypothetical protein BO66DRAFT_433422 [Aspergillus aculeatinus CBS 121060]
MPCISSRPLTLPNFISRLRDQAIETAEKEALQAWGTTAVDACLSTSSIPQLAWEAARLSEVLVPNGWIKLLRNFVNAVIVGSIDGTSLSPVLLRSLAFIIRQREGQWSSESTEILGALFSSLKVRLEQADRLGGSVDRKYELVCVLGVVIDAMVDIGVSDISHEQLYKPLIALLDGFSHDRDLHVAQAAAYTGQALRGIQDDDTVGKASLRGLLRAIDLAMTVSGAVSSVDPSKIWEAVKSGIDGASRLRDFTWDMFKKRTGKSWYTALRATSILIRTRSWDELSDFIQQAECRANKDFLCGLYAQLDLISQLVPPDQIQHIYKSIPESKYDRVQAWKMHTVCAIKDQTTPPEQKLASTLKRTKTYDWSLKSCGWEDVRQDLSDDSSALLDDSYRRCMPAREYYTKNALLEFYSQDDDKRLQIQRLSGARLPVDHCYINLNVVDSDQGDEVPLESLFDCREQGGRKIRPKKIFIEGQAGVGKTTLCKKVVHDFLYRNLWSDRFDWILWLPLRHLKGKRADSYSIKDLFHHEYFSQHQDSELVADTLDSIVARNSARVLWLLDGLDEVAQDWDADSPMGRFLQTLLKQPQTIISSRPYSTKQLNMAKQDLKLQTVGFHAEQIEKYIRAKEIHPDPGTADKIWEFIDEHSRIREIAQIPIQLDALCYTWKESLGNINTARTMTTIYQAICVELLRKDLWRREKRIDGRTLTEQQTEELSEFEVQLHMQEEINLLEALAFHGLLTNIIDFDAPVRIQIYQHLLNGNVLVPRLHESAIKEISFLRSSDATDNAQQSFHFLHLTVQEFFAARFFAKHWTSQATIHSLTLNGRTDTDIPPQVFMAREKYNVRYEVFWRFVAGFLGVGYNHQKQSEEHTAAFLEVMENKPRDMLGPMHSKLMMRLWSEVPASNNIARLRSLRQSHYQRLARWSSFEVTAYDKGELAGEAEYPDTVLYSLLENRSSDVKRHVLNVIAQRRVSTSVTDLIASWVDQVSDDELNPVFVRTLLRNCRSLSPKAYDILLVHLHDESKVEESDFKGVQVPALPQDLLRAILDCLHYGPAGLKAAALEILSEQPPSALQAYVDTIAHGLSDPESEEVTSKSLKILERLDLSLEILQSMTYLVYEQIGSYPSPFDIVKKSLCRHSLVSPSILGYVCSLLDHRSFIVRKLAVRVLAQHPLLPPSTADWLGQEVHFGDCLVKDLRTTVWQQLLPSQNIREDIVRRLKHIDPAVRGVAALILGGRSDLSKPTFEAVAELLNDTKWSVREAAAKALRGQSELPHHVLDRVAGLLGDHHPLVRYQAIKTLTKYPDDELKYLDDVVLSLEDPDFSVAYKASEAIRKHPKVPRELLYHLFAQMIDPQDHHTSRFDPIFRSALRRGLPPDLGNRLLDLAESADIEGEGEGEEEEEEEEEERDVEHILDLLGAQTFLPPGKLLQLSERFVTSDDRIASAVVKILVAQAHLPPPLILALTRFLDRADKTLVLNATLWLLGQSELPLEALALMAGMLPTVPLPGFAADILSRQPSLPSEIMNLALSAFRLATDERYAEIHEVLERNDAFYRMLPQLPVHDLQRLCRIWLRRSFGERVNFYFRDGSLVVDTPDFQGAIPMPLYQRIKLWLIFRLTVLACTRASDVERVRGWIRGSVAWMGGHRALVLAFVAAVLAVILRWALW